MSRLGSSSRKYPLQLKRQLIVLDVCLMLAITLGLYVVMFRSKLLPARFMGDEQTIQELAQGRWSADGDNSYSQVSAIYRLLGLANEPTSAGFFGFLVACIPYIIVCAKYRSKGSNATVVLVLATGILLSAVYMGTYSKEVFVVPVIILVILARHNVLGLVAICGAMALYAAYFRNYWFLVLIFFLVLSFSMRRISTARHLYIACAGGILVGSILFSFIMGVPSDHFRNSVNIYRAASGDVNTLIPRYIEFGTILDGPINNVLSFIFLQLPFPLLLKFSPYYLVLFVVLAVLWIGLFRGIGTIGILRNPDLEARLTRVVLFILAFVMTQAFFEPDFGSALRHLTPFLPLFVMLHLANGESIKS